MNTNLPIMVNLYNIQLNQIHFLYHPNSISVNKNCNYQYNGYGLNIKK